jgi:dTDP-4-dehydrorhamnose 3,5-epimerase
MDSAGFSIEDQPLPGVYVLNMPRFDDDRGIFLKTFHAKAFATLGIPFEPAEQFITCSGLNVLRGMHYQVEEAAHLKLVTCPIGRILDVVVDIRPESDQFNQPFSIELNSRQPRALLIDKGYAHGFLTIEDQSWVQYLTSTVHDPDRDRGVHWASIDFDWPVKTPAISKRDSSHPSIIL